MNGPHDLGGRHGFGPVTPEPNEPPWHYDWEARMHVMALVSQVRGLFVLDEQRHACEQLPPAMYLYSNYYDRWCAAVSGILVEKGVIDQAALDAKVAALLAGDTQPPPSDGDGGEFGQTLVNIIHSGASAMREPTAAPRFSVGDHVVTKNMNAPSHHRLPSYAKGKPGAIEALHGAFTLNDSLARGDGESPTHVYMVRFDASDLWGDAAEAPDDTVYLDLFETYLKPV